MDEIKDRLDQIIALLQVIAGDKLPQHMWSQQRSAAEATKQQMTNYGMGFSGEPLKRLL